MTTCIFSDSELATRAVTTAREKDFSAAIEVHTLKGPENSGILFVMTAEGASRQQLEKVLTRHSARTAEKSLADSAIHCPHCDSIWVIPPLPQPDPGTKEKLLRVLSTMVRCARLPPEPLFRCIDCKETWEATTALES